MSSFHAPGTVFRSYNADRSAHNTAVLLKDGRVLELKNADGSPKKTHDTYAAWLSERGIVADAIETDTSKATGIVITTDTHGFNVNLKDLPQYGTLLWPVWCYRIIAEAAPQLLDDAAVKDAFNNLTAISEKHKSELNYSHWYSKEDYYNPAHLTYREEFAMKGMKGMFGWEYFPRNGWTKEMYAAAKTEIGAAYTILYNLIAPAVRPFLEKKFGLAEETKKLKKALQQINHMAKREQKIQRKEYAAKRAYEWRMKMITEEKEKVAKWKASAEAAAAEAKARLAVLK